MSERQRQHGLFRPRVLYLPNESKTGGEQVGGRAAFQHMLNEGTISALHIYSFLSAYHLSGRNRTSAHAELLLHVRQFKPDLIFWSHPEDYPVTGELLTAMRTSCHALLVYHEGDPYDRLYKRLKSPQKLLYAASDIFFTSGLGAMRKLFQHVYPHHAMHYAPSYTECERFGVTASPGRLGSSYDAVMIGNIPRRLRVFRHPGSAQRVQLARGLRRLMGDRFGCFGKGWPAALNASGPVRHVSQRELIQSARMSLMWEHFPGSSFYFSDRLPIALAAGVPFITSARAGYDVLFSGVPGLFLANTVEEALDMAVYLRSQSLETIAALGAAARRWVLDNLEARPVFRRMIGTCIQHCFQHGGGLK